MNHWVYTINRLSPMITANYVRSALTTLFLPGVLIGALGGYQYTTCGVGILLSALVILFQSLQINLVSFFIAPGFIIGALGICIQTLCAIVTFLCAQVIRSQVIQTNFFLGLFRWSWLG